MAAFDLDILLQPVADGATCGQEPIHELDCVKLESLINAAGQSRDRTPETWAPILDGALGLAGHVPGRGVGAGRR